jgi:hypothetical protein
MSEEKFSPEQSLQVIQTMIDRAKENVKDNSFYFLLWGWLVFAAALIHFGLMKFTDFKQPWLAWNLMWIGAILSMINGIRQSRQGKVKTYIGETMKYFGICQGIIFGSLAFIFGYYDLWHFSFPVYILIYAVACFFMGAILQFSLLKWTGLSCLLIMAASVFVAYQWQLLLVALAVLIAYIIPGHVLKTKENN